MAGGVGEREIRQNKKNFSKIRATVTEKTAPEVDTFVFYAQMYGRFVEYCPNLVLPRAKLREALFAKMRSGVNVVENKHMLM